jgi:hypothetical protein
MKKITLIALRATLLIFALVAYSTGLIYLAVMFPLLSLTYLILSLTGMYRMIKHSTMEYYETDEERELAKKVYDKARAVYMRMILPELRIKSTYRIN